MVPLPYTIPSTYSLQGNCKLLIYYKGDYIVAFGDGMNDIDMFEIADEAYAVENAVDELKSIATGIIGSNNSDGVVRWLVERSGIL